MPGSYFPCFLLAGVSWRWCWQRFFRTWLTQPSRRQGSGTGNGNGNIDRVEGKRVSGGSGVGADTILERQRRWLAFRHTTEGGGGVNEVLWGFEGNAPQEREFFGVL